MDSSKVFNRNLESLLATINEISGLTDKAKSEFETMLIFADKALEYHHKIDQQITANPVIKNTIESLNNITDHDITKNTFESIKDYKIIISDDTILEITPNTIFINVANNQFTYTILNPYGNVSKNIVLNQPKPPIPFTQDSLHALIPDIVESIIKSEAIIVFQRLRRMKLTSDNFFSTHGKETYQLLLDLYNADSIFNKANRLASHMIGKTVSGIQKKNITPTDDSFPIYAHPTWKGEALYHRFDFYNNDIFNLISLSYQADIKTEFPDSMVIPISHINNSPIEEIINQYLTPSEQMNIKIHKNINNRGIGIVEIRKNKYFGTILATLTNSGLIPSPWELAQLFVKFKMDENPSEIKQDPTIQNLLSFMPKSFLELKNTEWMKLLENMILENENPNRLLAICLHNMLTALIKTPAGIVSNSIIQRIAIFLAMGVKLHSHNYERFSFTVYAIVHEISLLIREGIENGYDITNYSKFKATIKRDSISSLGLQHDELNNYSTICSPAISGSNAFIIALSLAKKMSLPKGINPLIMAIGSIYFEFNKFIAPNLPPQPDFNNIADIYHISAGPIANPDGITPGTDINKLLNDLKLKKNQTWPITLLVDMTTALHQNLKLDPSNQKLVENGEVSIICYESYQKFGLIHTDQLQSGVVYGVCSHESYKDNVIYEFETNAKTDFSNHLDMAVTAFLHENCGPIIQLIKKRHFENGKLFNDFFQNQILPVKYSSVGLENLNEIYFLVAADSNLIASIKKNVAYRQSFGHFSTTYSNIDDKIRVSPNASDTTDIIVQIFQLNLSKNFSKDELYHTLYAFLCYTIVNEKPLAKEHQIILSAILMALHSLNPSMQGLTIDEKILLTIGINQLVSSEKKSIFSRSHNQFLYHKIIHHDFNLYLSQSKATDLLVSIFDTYGNKDIFRLFQDKGFKPSDFANHKINIHTLFHLSKLPPRGPNRKPIDDLNAYMALEENYEQREAAKKMVCLLKKTIDGDDLSENEFILLHSGKLGEIIKKYPQASEMLREIQEKKNRFR